MVTISKNRDHVGYWDSQDHAKLIGARVRVAYVQLFLSVGLAHQRLDQPFKRKIEENHPDSRSTT